MEAPATSSSRNSSHVKFSKASNKNSSQRTQRKSANHLLNFHLPERKKDEIIPTRRFKVVNVRRREDFLQANSRFVFSPSANILLISNPDKKIDWNLLVQVIVHCQDEVLCPICLDQPKLPKITCCGHIFCWCCISRYLSSCSCNSFSLNSSCSCSFFSKKCPMCLEEISREQLYRVQIKQHTKQVEVLDRVKFNLLRKKDGFLYLVGKTQEGKASHLITQEESKYSRISIASPSYLTDMLNDEKNEIFGLLALAQEDDFENIPFLEEGLGICIEELNKIDLEERKGKIQESIKASKSEFYDKNCKNQKESSEQDVGTSVNQISSINEDISPIIPSSIDSNFEQEKIRTNVSNKSIESKQQEKEDGITIYQIQDGRYIFLHPFNLRCLMHEYGSDYKFLPTEISGKVIDIENISLTPEYRNRYRFLRLLPLYSEVLLCELDLGKLLSTSTRRDLEKELKKRQEQRKRKKRKEKGKVSATDQNGSLYQPFITSASSSLDFFPTLSSIEIPSVSSADFFPSLDSTIDSSNISNDLNSFSMEDKSRSFATITQEHGYFPVLPISNPSISPPPIDISSNTVWRKDNNKELQNSISTTNSTATSNKKVKNKGKKISLFTNSQRRSYN